MARKDQAGGRKALGRGIGALIPPRPEETRGSVEVELGRIEPNPYQPRRDFDEKAIGELSESIRVHGVIQPLIVTRVGDRFQLVAGERRLRAARKAGLRKVPVVVREDVPSEASLALALIENIQREDLNPIEEARAYRQLHDEFGLTQEEIAGRVGKERSTVANHLRLLRLPDSVQGMLAGGLITMGHARALLAIDRAERQKKLAQRIANEGLSVRQVESMVGEDQASRARKSKPRTKDVFTRDAEEKLMRALKTKVEIDRRRRGGTIRVVFSNEEELIRLFEQLSGYGRKK